MSVMNMFHPKWLFVCLIAFLTNHICSGDVTLSELWGRANSITYVIDDVLPNWYYHLYDDHSYPMNSIHDGGGDLFDVGNMVRYLEGTDTSGEPLTYGNAYHFNTSSVQVGTTSHPFITLAWIENKDGIHTNYTIQVDSDLGADGGGIIERISGSIQIEEEGRAHLEYQVFQVYDAGDPTYCEVYFAISYEKWNSTSPLPTLQSFINSHETDLISNSVTLDGAIQNVAFGYTLLTVNNGNMIAKENIEKFLNQLMLRMIDEETLPAHPVSGECDGTIQLNTRTTTMLHPLSIITSTSTYCDVTIRGMDGYQIDALLNVAFSYGTLCIHGQVREIMCVDGNVNDVYLIASGDLLRFTYSYLYSSNNIKLKPRKGITATYEQYKSTCGRELRSSTTEQHINVIGSTDDDVCVWIISRWDLGLIKLVITRLVLINHHSYLQISNTFDRAERVENNITSPITLYGNEFRIKFRGGSNSLLTASYRHHLCSRTYSLKTNETSATLTSSMLELNAKRLNPYHCQWTFNAQSGFILVVELQMDNVTALRSDIDAYDNNTSTRWKPQGGSTSYLSKTGFLRLDYNYNYNYGHYSAVSPPIKIIYNQVKTSCGDTLYVTSLPQTIAAKAGNASDCLWTIQGSLINLTINTLQLESGDYLKVFDGPYLLHTMNGSLHSPISLTTITSYEMRIIYHTTSNKGNFSATYNMEEEICDQTYRLIDMSTRTVGLQLPSFIGHIIGDSHSLTCNLYFVAKNDHVINMDIQRNISNSFLTRIMVYDDETYLGSFQNNYDGTNSFISSKSKMRLKITVDFYYYLSNIALQVPRVDVTFRQVNITCGDDLVANSTSQMLHPPGQLLSPADEDCLWIITSSSLIYHVQLTIEQLDIEDGFLQVNGKMINLGKFRNESTPIVLLSDVNFDYYFAETNYEQGLKVYFHRGSGGVSNVWRASYKEVECGKTLVSTINLDQYLSFPRSIVHVPSNLTCDYTFVYPAANWLVVEVTDYYPSSCCSKVQIFKDNQLIGSTDEQLSTLNFLAHGSQLRLHYVTNSSSYQANRYSVRYRSIENTCGSQLQATDTKQSISATTYGNYGAFRRSFRGCVWVIKAKQQNQISFTIDLLDVGLGEYLEINDGSKGSQRYRGTSSSSETFVSAGSTVDVYFRLGFYGHFSEFKASFVEVVNPCSENPCKNNGVCIGLGESYSCICESFYKGTTCQYFISPCLNNPCGDHGQCQPTNDSMLFKCDCYPGYAGDRCYGNINECEQSPNPCDDNANCTDIEAGYDCTCNEGYRGDGKVECYKKILMSYGKESGDSLLPIGDDKVSRVEKLDFEISFGSKSYSYIRVTSNGLIYLGRSLFLAGTLNRPTSIGFPTSSEAAVLAPFWDDFHPSEGNSGRVYYQSYNKLQRSLSASDNAFLDEVKRRIVRKFNLDNFDPIYVFKATWSEVVMFPEDFPGHRRFPSTFQAVLATDGCDTYLIYLYKEDAMLWLPGIRSTDNVLIGYSNGDDMIYVESQGDYRPDMRVQKEGGDKTGEYFYKLSASNTNFQKARCKCLKWYLADLKSQWSPERMPCPCSSFQASLDPAFTRSLDYASVKNKLSNLNSTNSDLVDSVFSDVQNEQCYQPRIGSGPKCCYGIPRRWFFTFWWRRIGARPLLGGPFGSRYEKHQIPSFSQNDTRSQEQFEEKFWNAFNGDLLPRQQCCIESESGGYCRMYERRRPAATCWGYISTVPAFLWGDPHITTFTGISYTFNGLGEFYLVNTPEFSLQSRTKRVLKEDGSLSNATVFVAFAAKDFTKFSGIVQFDVDYNDANGTGVIVKVNGRKQTLVYGNEIEVDNITLKWDESGYSAIFPSLQKVSVKSNSYLLTISLIGNPNQLKNRTGGLLGDWTDDKENTFELRNGTVLDYESLKVTEDLDVLNGTLSERMLYPFGLSWQINKPESLFNYTGGNDTFEAHNPPNPGEPPFLEELVSQQRNTSLFNITLSNCTVANKISTSCLYDTMTTNRSDIGQATLSGALSAAAGLVLNSNTPPNISVNVNSSLFVDGYFQVRINETAILHLVAEDIDGDHVTFYLSDQSTVIGAEIGEETGILQWNPDDADLSVFNKTLEVVAVDGNEGESLMIIPVKLCACYNGGQCVFDDVISSSVNYEIVGCNCTEAWTGDDCTEDRNDCNLSVCYPGVNCTDVLAPGVGVDCGTCPDGTTGDGRNCTTINLCNSKPCSQICDPIFNGYNCSCNDGYEVDSANSSNCIDINECLDNATCSFTLHSTCNNTEGSYSCDCLNGFVKNGSRCMDVDECFTDLHNCSQNFTCINTFGGFECECNSTSCFEDLGTTKSSITTEANTQQSPSTEVTTQQSPTAEDTTQQTPTSEGTTQQTPTSEGTTQQTSTTEVTTQRLPPTEVTTQQPSTTEVTTQQPSTTEVATQQPSTTEVATQQPSTTEVTSQQPSTTVDNTQATSTSVLSTIQPDNGGGFPDWAIAIISVGGAALVIGGGLLILRFCRSS